MELVANQSCFSFNSFSTFALVLLPQTLIDVGALSLTHQLYACTYSNTNFASAEIKSLL